MQFCRDKNPMQNDFFIMLGLHIMQNQFLIY